MLVGWKAWLWSFPAVMQNLLEPYQVFTKFPLEIG